MVLSYKIRGVIGKCHPLEKCLPNLSYKLRDLNIELAI